MDEEKEQQEEITQPSHKATAGKREKLESEGINLDLSACNAQAGELDDGVDEGEAICKARDVS
ncbi:MAG: hypothetical protein UV20_C0021G0003 [Candidatus Magasanikbacteria bacterium GW2011_GWA2_42_32]|nr:MAG: hypothetical protein UV20_C0021G0003 [Candidatus Magasanikbacteria bacterium GW2011_GWA2_42_32]